MAGTPVLTSDGYTSIENVKAGDMVWSKNMLTGEIALKEVVRTFVNETYELVHVYINDEEIIATPEHPFYVTSKGWVGAGELRPGDILSLRNGDVAVVGAIWLELLVVPTKVYNFEVEDFHTYYVGDNSVLVHNVCLVKKKGVKIEVRTSNEHGLPHAHVSGNGPNTTVGLDKMPMKNHPNFSRKQAMVIEENWETIQNGIIEFFPKRP